MVPHAQEGRAAAPRISIVTPSFNQAAFLPETLASVFGQGYPNLEYIVMDGGSTDGSVGLIEAMADRLAYWVSEADDGQSAAINHGFRRATGDILGWLNSDDAYLPGALALAARTLDPQKAQILHGDTVYLSEETGRTKVSRVADIVTRLELDWTSTIVQPSSFMTRRAWELVGELDESLHYAMDWDWFLRAKRAGVEFVMRPQPLSVYRLHAAQKTTPSAARTKELRGVYRRHNGPRGERLYMATRGKRAQSFLMRGLLKLSPWRGVDDTIVRLVYPLLALRFTPREIESTVRML
jgi:glycosyltransferase involved in cell wall biosynthesis